MPVPVQRLLRIAVLSAGLALAPAVFGSEPLGDAAYQPEVGQEGKDVVWVPTPPVLVEKMLDMARVTPRDFVIDLGSGDGRNVIAAARRGARALGVEYNPDMVALSRRLAKQAGVEDRATFVQGDMFEADISQATVLAIFLLPENMNRLADKFLALRPGTRIVSNAFSVDGWEPDETEKVEGDCGTWCTALLFIVPARVEGRWRIGGDELRLTQHFQRVRGTLVRNGSASEVWSGSLRGDRLTFRVGNAVYQGRVNGDRIEGAGGAWIAERIREPATARP